MTFGRSYQFTHALCREPASSVSGGLRLEDTGNPDPALLARQHEIYIEALIEAGVTVNTMPARESFPDSVFVEDAALMLGGTALLLNPGAPSRAGEPAVLKEDGADYVHDMLSAQWDGFVDGGDILAFDDMIIVGLSRRTQEAGVTNLAQVVGAYNYTVRTVQTPRDILHFKSHCSVLNGTTALSTQSLADTGCFEGFDVLITPEDEPQGANVIRVNDKVIMPAEAPKTAALLKANGFDVLPVPTSEVAKIDGAVSCCSLRYSL